MGAPGRAANRHERADWIAPADIAPLAPTEQFLEMADRQAIAFDEGDCERLGLYLALVLCANTHFNLTSIRDPGEAWIRHIFDSLTLLSVIDAVKAKGKPSTIIDVGSGAGLPGMPLALTRPDLHVTLLEATGKKAEFLRSCAQRLDMRNIEIVNARAEAAGAYPSGAHREQYDVVLARALGPLRVALELCAPFACVHGIIAMTKGARADEELAQAEKAMRVLKCEHSGTIQTPTGRIVVLHKLEATPRAYPRRDGEPKRAPLGGG